KTIMGLNYLYNGEGDDLPLINGHQYGIRVQAVDPMETIGFDNNGYSEIHTFTFTSDSTLNEEEEYTVELPEDCESRCNIVAIQDSAAISDLSVLEFIRIGYFPIFNADLTPTEGGYSGTGEIQLNFL